MKKQIICNKCGKEFACVNDVLQEDGLFVRKEWGYFSRKDLQIHSFILCEECYDEMIHQFAVPVEVEENSSAVDG